MNKLTNGISYSIEPDVLEITNTGVLVAYIDPKGSTLGVSDYYTLQDIKNNKTTVQKAIQHGKIYKTA